MTFHAPCSAKILTLLIVLACGAGVSAQERRGPTTLENLLDDQADAVPHGTVSRPRHGSTDPAIENAWKRYDEAVGAASARLLQRIEKRPGRASPRGDAHAMAGAEAAKKAFVERGILPSLLDAGLKKPREEAEAAYREAAVSLQRQYEAVVARHRDANRGDEAAALGQEWALLRNALDLAKEPQFDSTWHHSIANGPSAEITLFSNGTINAPDGPDTWTLTGKTLVIRWRNTDAPGGEWVDTCEVSADAGSYAGTNQLGTRITGTRVP